MRKMNRNEFTIRVSLKGGWDRGMGVFVNFEIICCIFLVFFLEKIDIKMDIEPKYFCYFTTLTVEKTIKVMAGSMVHIIKIYRIKSIQILKI